jgi:hypothetical protein
VWRAVREEADEPSSLLSKYGLRWGDLSGVSVVFAIWSELLIVEILETL